MHICGYMKLMQIRKQLQELRVQEEEHELLISSGMELLSNPPFIEEVDKPLIDIQQQIEALRGNGSGLQPSLSLEKALTNFDRAKAQI